MEILASTHNNPDSQQPQKSADSEDRFGTRTNNISCSPGRATNCEEPGLVEQRQASVIRSTHNFSTHPRHFPVKIRYQDTGEVLIARSPYGIEPDRTFYLLELSCAESRADIMTNGSPREPLPRRPSATID